MATTTTQQPTAAPVAVPAQTTPVGAPAPVPAGPVTQPPPGTTVNRPQVSASLYIGDLDPEVGESALYDLFKEIGNVASIRVCRDAISRVSLGYAYVNFHSVESAERAISVLNGALLNNRPCRIMWSRRDPSIRKSGVGNIFIKNLSSTVDHANLYDIFSTFGNIHSCKLVTNKAGQSRGYGFVHFHTKESADMAIKKMNNLKVNGKQVYVAPFISSRDRQRINPNDVYTNVYIKNIDENVTQEEFQKHFEQFGSITSAKLMNTEEKTKTRFGFVNYMTHEQAVRCVTETNNSEFHGKTLFAARAQSRAERSEELRKRREERANKYQGVNLYIKNIDDSVDEEKLRKAFAEFGAITSVKIMTNDKGLSKGFGFVCFSKPEEATKALTKMNNVMVENKPLYVALAQRKEQRRAQLEAQYAQRTNIRMNQPGAGMGITPPMYAGPMFYPQVAAANQNRAFMYGPQMTQPFRGNRAPFNSTQQGAQFGSQHVGFPVTAAQGQSVRGRGNNNNPGRGVAQGRNPGQQPQQPQQGRVPQAQPGQQPPQQQQGNRKNQPNVKNPPSPSTGRNSAQDDAQANPKEQLANLLFEQVANSHHQDVAEKIVEHLVSNHSENELQQFLDEKDRLDQAANDALKVIESA